MSTNIATAASLDDTAQSPSAPLSGKARYQKVCVEKHSHSSLDWSRLWNGKLRGAVVCVDLQKAATYIKLPASPCMQVKDVEHAPRGRVQLCVDRVTGEHVAIEYLWRDDEVRLQRLRVITLRCSASTHTQVPCVCSSSAVGTRHPAEQTRA